VTSRRRSFLASAAALLAAPFAHSQTPRKPRRVGVLVNGPEHVWSLRFAGFRKEMTTYGYVEGRDVVLDVRWNDQGLSALEGSAAELLRARPDVVVAWPVVAARALHQRSRTVPIVMAGGAGALEMGLAASLARPGGNVTGIISRGEAIVGKRVELLRAIAPHISRAAFVFSGQQLIHDAYMQAARESAKSLNLVLVEQKVTTREALAHLAPVLHSAGCQGLLVAWDVLMVESRPQLIGLAAELRVPAVYPLLEFAREGGLASYSASASEIFRRAAYYVDRILKGANPAEMPIEQPTKFDLAFNLKTAKALGLKIPESLLVRADEVIQ
jgi:putative ABC transport system substrate-binding protein